MREEHKVIKCNSINFGLSQHLLEQIVLTFIGINSKTMPTYHITFLQTNTYTFANSAGPDETARNVLSYRNLNCLPLYY